MMAHYAFLNKNNIVTHVIPGRNENEVIDGISDWEEYYQEVTGQKCKRTSYNTFNGVHKDGGVPFRKNYAAPGHFYNEELDAFIPPQPHDSWTLDEETCSWNAPILPPDNENSYLWNEEIGNWELFIPPKVYESWVWNEETNNWNPPIPYPQDQQKYQWNEQNQTWDLLVE
jgi:hypothetical protein